LGFYFGAPYYTYPYYGYPYRNYYAPPPVVITVPPTPPVYIQQQAAPDYPSGYWYYCDDPQGYYPTVRECPDGWQRVPPTAPPPR
jgi:hypothetical protein